MSQRIKGLFLKATKLNHLSTIVELYTQQHGRASFIFSRAPKKNTSFLFQPFHFIEFSCSYNNEKKINRGSKPELIFPIIDVISDIRKTGYALLLTEILNKVIHKEDKNEVFFLALKKMILSFEEQHFNSVFGIFFLKELLIYFGIQPINNYSSKSPFFLVSEGRFSSESDPSLVDNFPYNSFHQLLGTNIDNIISFKINTVNRRLIMELLLRYMFYYDLINTDKLNSIKILQSIYD